MARKKRTRYTADELRALEKRLTQHRDLLAQRIQRDIESFKAEPTAELARPIRDAAELLSMTCHCLGQFSMLIALAERSGGEVVPFLDECGLEE